MTTYSLSLIAAFDWLHEDPIDVHNERSTFANWLALMVMD